MRVEDEADMLVINTVTVDPRWQGITTVVKVDC
jgi:hypothetical protein